MERDIFHPWGVPREIIEIMREREGNFPITAGWRPNKQFCCSESAPFQILWINDAKEEQQQSVDSLCKETPCLDQAN